MKGRFSNIEQQLRTILGEELLGDIYHFRQKRLAHITRIIASIEETLPAGTASGTKPLQKAILRGIEELQKFSEVEEYHAIQEVIVEDILALKDKFPRREILREVPERFKILEEDELWVKGGKAVKQAMRKMGKTEWVQRIPLQEVVAYHLLDTDWFFKDWIAAEERLSMQIILELDQVLAHALKNEGQSGPNAELKQILKVIKNHIEEAKRLHKQKLIEARETFINQFITQFAKVGTFERRNSFYSQNRLQRKQKQTKKELQAYIEKWQQINRQLLKRTAVLHQFLSFFDGLDQVTRVFKSEVEDVFNKFFFTSYQKLRNQIEEAHSRVIDSGEELASVLAESEQRLVKCIEDSLIENLRESIEKGVTEHQIALYAEQLLQRAGELPKTAVVITNIDRSNDPPTVQLKEISLESAVRRHLREMLLQDITDKEKKLVVFKNKLLNEAHEIEDIIEVNLESASELILNKDKAENPRKITDEALERAIAKVEKCLTQIKETQQDLLEPLEEGSGEFRHAMFELLYKPANGKQRMADGKGKVSEKTDQFTGKWYEKWGYFQQRSAVLRRFTGSKIKKYYRKSTGVLGLKPNESKEIPKADIVAYLLETQKQIDSLPYIYRRLFDFKAEANARYHVGLNEQTNQVQDAYDYRQQGPAALAVVGEKGSGKSSFFDITSNTIFGDKKVLRINSEESLWTEKDLLALFSTHVDEAQISSIDALADYLNQKQGPDIIMLEGIQNLYLRNLNGYSAIEQLLYLITETNNQVFWMVSCSRYAWSYLNEITSVADYFSHLVETDKLNEAQIRKVIMNRHRASGYELVFVSSEDDIGSRAYRKLSDDEEKKQEYLRDKYFKKMAKLAEGNASVAMLFWIRSIQKFDNRDCFIAPLEAVSLDMLDDLEPQTLFVLAALILHDRLTPAALALTQNMSKQQSQMIVKRLKGRGIVTGSDQGGMVNHLMYRQVIKELKDRNILHF